jgi:hypothetical protein
MGPLPLGTRARPLIAPDRPSSTRGSSASIGGQNGYGLLLAAIKRIALSVKTGT